MRVKNILINFPTNIGDTILALPVLDRLKAEYPHAKITAISSFRTHEFLSKNNFIDEAIIFDKHWPIKKKMIFSLSLRGKYDMVVDLKNSLLPIIICARLRTPIVRLSSRNINLKDKYIALVKNLTSEKRKELVKSDFNISSEKKYRWDNFKLPPSIFVSCVSRSSIKNYPYEYLKIVAQELKANYHLVFLGEEKDRGFYRDILSLDNITDLVGKTDIIDVFYLVKNYAKLILGVDTTIIHIGSYLNIPVVALFGPTDYRRTAPTSDSSFILRRKDVRCAPCEKSKCNSNYECMKIPPQEVIETIKKILNVYCKTS
ncbi:MAG: glycosyltransferase family 9 protein [Candidatus Omnitrophica bacterium]|nr:glycosyltransferase family 9 protein [Candidatus Omnitrophota bacterium]